MKRLVIKVYYWVSERISRLWNRPFLVQFIEDPIDHPKNKVLYVVGTLDEPWQVELVCPCGCGDKIVLPVNDSTQPRWRLNIKERGVPTLEPSIWRSKGCKSHFFLRRGQVDWV